MDSNLKEQVIAALELGLELADPKRFTMANRIDIKHVVTQVKNDSSLPDVSNKRELLISFKEYWNTNNDIRSEEIEIGDIDAYLNSLKSIATYRTFKCNRCYATYQLIAGVLPKVCTGPVEYRTSGVCGGELVEVIR